MSSSPGEEESWVWPIDMSVSTVDSALLECVVNTKTGLLDTGFGSKDLVVSENKHKFITVFRQN